MTTEQQDQIDNIEDIDHSKDSTLSEEQLKIINDFVENLYDKYTGDELTQNEFNTLVNNSVDSLQKKEIKQFITQNTFKIIKFKQEIINGNATDITNGIAEVPEGLNTIITKIDAEPDIEVKKSKIKELIENKEYGKAISEAFNLLWKAIFGEPGKTGLNNFKDLDEYIKTLNINDMDETELTKNITILEDKITQIKDPKKKMRYTYVMSSIKDALTKKEKGDDSLSKKELLNSNLKEGDVLLLNKNIKSPNMMSKIGDGLLRGFNKSIGNNNYFLHSVIVSKIENGKPYITHSTLKRHTDKEGKGGIEEIALDTLLGGYQSADILSLRMPEENKTKTLDYVGKKLAEQKLSQDSLYDKSAVISDVINIGESKDKVNCVELIAEGIGENKIKDINNPTDFLQSNILTPAYLTSV